MQATRKISIQAIKSKIITPGDDLFETLKSALKKQPLKNGNVLIITSKVVAITQDRIQKISSEKEFQKLVYIEADRVFPSQTHQKSPILTLKDHIFIPWAGMDRSNIRKGYVVLWPKEPYKVAQKLQQQLKKHYKLQKLGVIITDSCCHPLRKGVGAVALGYAGFKGVNDVRGKKDLYGNSLKITQQNMADMLAAAAHLVMGEAAESTPFAIIEHASLTFTNADPKPKEPIILSRECIFEPLYPNNHL